MEKEGGLVEKSVFGATKMQKGMRLRMRDKG
jgi:hypothetical protein